MTDERHYCSCQHAELLQEPESTMRYVAALFVFLSACSSSSPISSDPPDCPAVDAVGYGCCHEEQEGGAGYEYLCRCLDKGEGRWDCSTVPTCQCWAGCQEPVEGRASCR